MCLRRTARAARREHLAGTGPRTPGTGLNRRARQAARAARRARATGLRVLAVNTDRSHVDAAAFLKANNARELVPYRDSDITMLKSFKARWSSEVSSTVMRGMSKGPPYSSAYIVQLAKCR